MSERQSTPEQIAHAKAVYIDCVEEEIGMDVTMLTIEPNGDIDVEFGEGYTPKRAKLAFEICEARISSVIHPGEGISVLSPPANLGRAGTDAELERLLSDRARRGFEGTIVAEFKGKRRVDTGFGSIEGGSSQLPNSQTAFDCGSIMKAITAAVVFLLEQDGTLSRQQTLSDFLENVPTAWQEVTLQQVIEHSAGFDEYHDTQGDFEEMSRATALDRILAQEPLFAAGTERAYSNSGYTLLAILIETVTGEEFGRVVHDRVFAPLAMARSGLYAEGLWGDGNVAVGRGADVHGTNDPSLWPAPTWALKGNGGLVSTSEDLLKLAKAFDGEGLFWSETRAAFHRDFLAETTGSIGDESVIGYAGGNDFGFDAVVIQLPEDSTYVVAASSVFSAITAEILAVEVLQVLYGQVLERPGDE